MPSANIEQLDAAQFTSSWTAPRYFLFLLPVARSTRIATPIATAQPRTTGVDQECPSKSIHAFNVGRWANRALMTAIVARNSAARACSPAASALLARTRRR
jgi:hypothetical protein